MSASPVRLAIWGAGTFVRKAHIPSILDIAERPLEIVAVCSRSQASGEEVAALLPHRVSVFTDIDAMLVDDGIDAVDVALPIPLLPDAVRRCLAAGKHVISEKPIAPTVAEAETLIEFYAGHGDQVWMVGENWRYEEAYIAAGQLIRDGAIGRPLLCDWALNLPVMPGAPGHRTVWRRAGDFPGGFLLDGGVHHVAGLRAVLGEIESVSAVMASQRPDLPPADTMSTSLRFVNGAVGSYSVTYAARSGLASSALHVVGSEGSLRVTADAVTLWREGDEPSVRSFETLRSVERELAAFAHAIQHGSPHRNSPQQALQDLAVLEAMIAAAETGARQSVIRSA
ncbi:MAG: Gfo/Idh/MocA family oxidoreductase [Caldilineaceae bacterium]|nr:Gfo/Idh/MocA family oxidoreductase [Caldilineaceae bacterium]